MYVCVCVGGKSIGSAQNNSLDNIKQMELVKIYRVDVCLPRVWSPHLNANNVTTILHIHRVCAFD